MRATNIATGGISAVLAAALMLSTGPREISVASEHTGDTEISSALESFSENGHHNLAAFTYDDGEARFGGLQLLQVVVRGAGGGDQLRFDQLRDTRWCG